jgi:Rab proteins geranylgeranyltransferase component A
MDPDESSFALVIEGTGLTESIVAAAAAWAGKRVLHVDANTLYGSHWAAMSLDQLESWVQLNSGTSKYLQTSLNTETTPYRSATFTRSPNSGPSTPSLQASRAYSLDLSPHLLYCSSDLIACLANTKLNKYLEFKALEHIFVFQSTSGMDPNLQKVPSSREGVFTSSLSLQEKHKLMKFLNFAMSAESFGLSPKKH